jgi:hypothetical protein
MYELIIKKGSQRFYHQLISYPEADIRDKHVVK